MANAKSNIYPIQLQGAELCLNRYDAEIKQYSGFNKNNSPFVGGCLSNVFTKEEQISGGNADNTYIDTNGNVYRVDNTGVFRNENKIISYDNNVKFYQKRKLKMPANAVKVIAEDIYITKETNYVYHTTEQEREYTQLKNLTEVITVYIAHWGNGYSQVLAPASVANAYFLDIQRKGDTVVFSCKLVTLYSSNSQANSVIYSVCVPDCNESNFYFYKPDSNNDFWSRDRFNDYITAKSESNYLIAHPQGVFIDGDNIYIASNSRITSYVWVSIDQGQTFTKFNTFSANLSSNFFIKSSFTSYHMNNAGDFYFISANNDQFSFNLSAEQHAYIYYKVKIRIENGDLTFKSGCYLDVGTPGNSTYNFFRLNDSFQPYFSQYCAFYTMRVAKAGTTPIQDEFLSICDSFKNEVYSFANFDDEINKHFIISGGTCFYDGFKILINNGVVSNISIAEYETDANGKQCLLTGKSFNGVIIEDWNVIKDFTIYNGKCVYVTYDDNLYIVEPTTVPKLSFKLNQIVVNCNNEYNSYNLENNRVVHYGSDWNCSYLNSNVNIRLTQQIRENKYLIASGVNEYNQENNPSILFNMQPAYFSSTRSAPIIGWPLNYFVDDYSNIVISDFVKNYMINGAVNFYISPIADNKATYLNSACIGYYSNEELYGLPFPNNSDGNVQYNPNLFSDFISNFGVDVFVKNDKNVYQLIKEGQENIMAFFLGTLVEDLELVFILQGQYYGIIDNKVFGLQFNNGVVADTTFIVNIQGLQFVGNTPYEALFFSKTNRCLYSFTGANVLNQKQLVDKISEVRNYLYNPATQTVFLITDIGVLFYGLFGMFLLEYTNITSIFLLDNGIVMSDNNGNYRYIKYYLDEGDTDYIKENINVETSFYGMNNEMVTINDCLYFRIFSEEHEEGDLKVSATTISLSGRKTEETTFKIKASDWDKITHTIYLRYQPKTQRGLGVAFAIDSPFKIASMSVGSQPDAVLVDKVSKGAITAPSVTTNNNEW